MPVHTHPQCFYALQEQECIEWTDTWSDVTQAFDTRLDDEADIPEGLPELHAVIGGSWIRKLWKSAVVPRKFAAVDDDSPDGVAVSSHELCERVDHDIGAVIDRSRHVRRGEGVVYNKGQSSLMGN